MRKHLRRGSKPRRVTLGKPGTVKADNARAAAHAFLAREKGGGSPVPLPVSSHLRVGSVWRADIARFFHEYGRRKLGGANRSHNILRTMFDCAIAWGHRSHAAGNPRKGIVRYQRPPRGRLLGGVLRQLKNGNPVCVTAVRLLLVMEGRPGEMRGLCWSEVKADRLTLNDSKTGPRHVLLGEATRELLEGIAKTTLGEWVFPGRSKGEQLNKDDLYQFWIKVRRESGIVADVRLHDLRHSHVSHAVMNGESLHVAGRLLGHLRASTTNRLSTLTTKP